MTGSPGGAPAGSIVVPSTPVPLSYRQRLSAALQQLDERGVPQHLARPLWFRFMRRCALPVPPPLYLGLVGATLYFITAIAPVIGLLLWLLVWRHDAVSPIRTLPSILQIALVPSVAMVLLTRWRAWRLKLDRWHHLDPPEISATAQGGTPEQRRTRP